MNAHLNPSTLPQTAHSAPVRDDTDATTTPSTSLLTLFQEKASSAKTALVANHERKVDLIGLGARILDWGVFLFVGGLQLVVITNELFKHHILNHTFLEFLPTALSVVRHPLSAFFFGMGLIEGTYELVNIKRVATFMHRLNKHSNAKESLEWIKSKYFSLTSVEQGKYNEMVQTLIDEYGYNEDSAEEVIKFAANNLWRDS